VALEPDPRSFVFLPVALAAVLCACGPLQASMSLPNPARTRDTIEARQVYEVGPYKENHRYEAALVGWTPEAVQFAVRLVNNNEECVDPANFTFTLLDDAGRAYPFKPAGTPTRTTATGRNGAVLKDVTIKGEFPVSIRGETREVVLRVRPHPGRFCRDLDFHWQFAR